MFSKLETLLETYGWESGHNYTLYNKNNYLERIDYDMVARVMTYTNDGYRTSKEYIDFGTAEERLTELFLKFAEVGVNKI